MKRILFTATLIVLSCIVQAQSDVEEVNRELHLKLITEEFTNLPTDSAIQALEEKYFPLTSLAVCLYLLQADVTDDPETSLLYKRVTDIALKYSETGTFILLTAYENSGKVTEIFNQYAAKYGVKYISMGTKLLPVEVSYAIGLFNQQMEQHIFQKNRKEWRKHFHADLQGYYNRQLEKMSRKERKRVMKKDC